MSRPNLPLPTLTLSQAEARRAILVHQRLWPPRSLSGKAGILDYVRHVGCIQFDPIDMVGRNPDLVLQARVDGYRPILLQELLYTDRLLWDGWDKVQSIHLAADWPLFARHRARMVREWGGDSNPAFHIMPEVREAIREHGALSSNDLGHAATLHWSWGTPTRLSRVALEVLYAMGEVGIHHRTGTRRYFDLAERLVPPEVLAAPDPNPTDEAYQDWHVLRRAGGVGLALPNGSAEFWLAIEGVKAVARRAALARLVERGDAVAAAVEGVPQRTFILRAADISALQTVCSAEPPAPAAAFLAPLDNLTWDRELLRCLFGFDYTWEVYKPAGQRRYGYYVLPVLYGDRFVARVEPAFDKKNRVLALKGWWWEEAVRPDEAMQAALAGCVRHFMSYLGAEALVLGGSAPTFLRSAGHAPRP
jgi:uncharacterized protein YcaQ